MKNLNLYSEIENSKTFDPSNFLGEINAISLKDNYTDEYNPNSQFARATDINYPALIARTESAFKNLISADIIINNPKNTGTISILDSTADLLGDIQVLGITEAVAKNAPAYLKNKPANKSAEQHLTRLKQSIVASKLSENTMYLQRLPYGRFSNRTYLPVQNLKQSGSYLVLEAIKNTLRGYEKWTRQGNMIVEAANKYNAKKSNTPVVFKQGSRLSRKNSNSIRGCDYYTREGINTHDELTITLSGGDIARFFDTQKAQFADDGRFEKWIYTTLFDYDKTYTDNFKVVLTFKGKMFEHTNPSITFQSYDWQGKKVDVDLMLKSDIKSKWSHAKGHVDTLSFVGVWDNRTTGFDLFVNRKLIQGNQNLQDIIQRKKDEQAEIVLNNTILTAHRDDRIDTRAYKRLGDMDFVTTECDWDSVYYNSKYTCIEVTLKNDNKLIYCRAAAKNGELKLLGGIAAEKQDNRLSPEKVLELMA
mgnify:CR=1 FL=1|tara:strand:+ start:4548 stop:5978 length:1431 start_codon:yes stop_codon:yes gene_type:complete